MTRTGRIVFWMRSGWTGGTARDTGCDRMEKRLKFTIAGFTPGTAYVDVAELLASQWTALGIQSTVKPEDVALWVTRATAGEHHVSVYAASGGFRPLMDPVWFFPSASTAYWAPLHGLWYSSGGRAGEKPTGDIARIVEIYEQAMTTMDEKRAGGAREAGLCGCTRKTSGGSACAAGSTRCSW